LISVLASRFILDLRKKETIVPLQVNVAFIYIQNLQTIRGRKAGEFNLFGEFLGERWALFFLWPSGGG
jgi:hypothetical protein